MYEFLQEVRNLQLINVNSLRMGAGLDFRPFLNSNEGSPPNTNMVKLGKGSRAVSYCHFRGTTLISLFILAVTLCVQLC